jgi:hypothetical protein
MKLRAGSAFRDLVAAHRDATVGRPSMHCFQNCRAELFDAVAGFWPENPKTPTRNRCNPETLRRDFGSYIQLSTVRADRHWTIDHANERA